MNGTASAYLPVIIFLLVATGFTAISLTIGFFIRPRNPGGEKSITYECGNDPVGGTDRPVPARYYFFAMLLVLFDVEIVFLVPWAMGAKSLGLTGLAAVALFFLVLMGGYFYIWRKGDLEWD